MGPRANTKDPQKLALFRRKPPRRGIAAPRGDLASLAGSRDFNRWEAMQKWQDLLPQGARPEFPALVQKGRAVTWASLQAALDVAGSVARPVATAVTTRRSSWLQSPGFPWDVQQMTQDLPFEGSSLCSEQTGARLPGLTDSKAALKSLGLHSHELESPIGSSNTGDAVLHRPDTTSAGDRTRGLGAGPLFPPPPWGHPSWFLVISAPQSPRFDKVLEDDIPVPPRQDPVTPVSSIRPIPQRLGTRLPRSAGS